MKNLITNSIVLLLCIFSTNLIASPTTNDFKDGQISGVVIDNALNAPLPYVNIIIKDKAGEILTGGITDEDGNFEIKKIPEGDYIVSIQFIGFKKIDRAVSISRQNTKIDLGEIRLEEAAEGLDEVQIVAEVSTIQQKVDRKVINVGKDLTTAGPTASDIMNNLPSVNVDQQTGALSMRGNQNVRVMVDGKLSNIPASQLLRQIPSTSIKQIELITNPSAKYNPEGMSGIINIILHKNTTIGFNGNLNAGFAYELEPKFNSGLDLNYRNGKFNFFGNYSNNISKNANYGFINRVEQGITQTIDILDDQNSNLFKVGVDFYLNDKNTISVFTSQNLFDGGTDGDTDILNPDPSINQFQNINNKNDNTSAQYNFNYKLDFNKEGHNIELEADRNIFNGDSRTDNTFDGFFIRPNFFELTNTERNRTTINLDYVNPLTEKSKLELGLEARLFDNLIAYESDGRSQNDMGDYIPSTTLFDYKRHIYSAYITYSKQFEKWSYQFGVRAETVDVETLAQDTDLETNTVTQTPFNNNYSQLYPSAFLTYSPTEKNSYQLSFSRRVDRPGVGQVNPLPEWNTPLISQFGNQELLPQFTNSIEANYTRQLEKGSITAGVFYRLIEDLITQAVFVDRADLNRIILSFANFDNTSSFGVEVSANYRPTSWWSLNGSFDLYSQTQNSIAETLLVSPDMATENDIVLREIEVDNVVWNLRMFNNFRVNKKLSFSLFTMYRGQNEGVQFTSKPMFMTNTGMRYNFLDNKATFSLNYNDIFNTMKFRFEGDRPFQQNGEFNWESRTVFVGLSYRFGSGKYRAKSRKKRDDNESKGGGLLGG